MNVLVVDPHSDDWINCCGALIHHISNKDNIYVLALSGCEESLLPGFTLDDYHKEWKCSLRNIGLHPDDRQMGKIWFSDLFTVRRFSDSRQNILEILIKYRNEYRPNVVYCPSQYDIHQDHTVVVQECIRAFSKTCSIYGYDMTWNTLNNHLHHYIELTSDNVAMKCQSATIYNSQNCKNNNSLTKEFIESLAVVRGNRINVKYAEAFEIIISREDV